MAHSTSLIGSSNNQIYIESKPAVEEPTAEIVKEKLKAVLDFDKLCELGKQNGAIFFDDGKIVSDESGKRLVSDLKYNHTVIKEAFLAHLKLQGYSYNPKSELLTNGTLDSASTTFRVMKLFFANQAVIKEMNRQFKDVTFFQIYDALEYEEVKSVVKLFLDPKRFIPLLKERGWVVNGKDQDTCIVSPNREVFDLKSLNLIWKKQRQEVLQSLKYLGVLETSKSDEFVFRNKRLTLDEVYDLIKHQVIDQLICEAQSLGFSFDLASKEFTKEGLGFSIREVIMRIHFKRMDL